MAKQPRNPLQKFVRGILRDLVSQANGEKTNKPKQSKLKKAPANKLESQIKQKTKKQSRYIPLSVRFAVLERDAHQCVSCGKSPPKVILEVDHKVAFSKGGSHDMSNLQTLCFDCNRGKGMHSSI